MIHTVGHSPLVVRIFLIFELELPILTKNLPDDGRGLQKLLFQLTES